MAKTYIVNHQSYSLSELLEHCATVAQSVSVPTWEQEVWCFIDEWFNAEDEVRLQTSGSTGIPKVIAIKKKYLRNSAQMTLAFLDLSEGDTALLCLSATYIAGKMMIVRALEGGLDLLLREAVGNPLKGIEENIVFAAMVPLQVEKVFQEEGAVALERINQLIIGGAVVGNQLLRQLRPLKSQVWATYGMTETVSHVAMKRLSGGKNTDFFVPMPGVTLSTDERGCLLIEASHLAPTLVATNDIVSFDEEQNFRFVGRYDNIINSGGVKLVPEQIEEKIVPLFSERFIISAVADERLGQKLVLYIESSEAEHYNWSALEKELALLLPPYERPKALFVIPQFEETKSGKVKRSF